MWERWGVRCSHQPMPAVVSSQDANLDNPQVFVIWPHMTQTCRKWPLTRTALEKPLWIYINIPSIHTHTHTHTACPKHVKHTCITAVLSLQTWSAGVFHAETNAVFWKSEKRWDRNSRDNSTAAQPWGHVATLFIHLKQASSEIENL